MADLARVAHPRSGVENCQRCLGGRFLDRRQGRIPEDDLRTPTDCGTWCWYPYGATLTHAAPSERSRNDEVVGVVAWNGRSLGTDQGWSDRFNLR